MCLVVDMDNVGAEGNELIWYEGKVSLQKILNYFLHNILSGLIFTDFADFDFFYAS